MHNHPLPRFALFDSFGDRKAFDYAPTLPSAVALARTYNIAGDLLIADRANGHVVADAYGSFVSPAIVTETPR